jgi:hypothetical protein
MLTAVHSAVQVALQRLNPGRDFDDNIVFRGWSKMATPLTSFRITQVRIGPICMQQQIDICTVLRLCLGFAM